MNELINHINGIGPLNIFQIFKLKLLNKLGIISVWDFICPNQFLYFL